MVKVTIILFFDSRFLDNVLDDRYLRVIGDEGSQLGPIARG